jgi:hypothetical protein
MKGLYTIGLLILSNTFMTVAWYGHLKFKEMKWSESLGLLAIILISWAIAFFEYCFQVPANRIGFRGKWRTFLINAIKSYSRGYNLNCVCSFFIGSLQNRVVQDEPSNRISLFGVGCIFYV